MNNIKHEDAGKFIWVNNPCKHTGFESASCDICGYPDPRKVIAKLKAEITFLIQYQNDMYRDYLTECNALHEKIEKLESALTFCGKTDKESQARINKLEENFYLDASDPEIGPQIKNVCD